LGRFAAEHGLEVILRDPSRRLVKVAGPIAKLEIAFGTKLRHFEHRGLRFRARTGPLTVPTNLSEKIESVLGLDNRPVATSKIAFPRAPEAVVSHLPTAIAAFYGFPKTLAQGKGQCIGLIELGGGFRASDNEAAFGAMGLTPPQVIAIPVSGGGNTPGKDVGADGEVALDIQTAGGAAPGARIAVYFAPNTDQGFVDAITQAVHDSENATSVLSISWGSAEGSWTQQAIISMTSALKDAASLSVTVCAASGDGLAGDGVNDGKAHVDFPASSPYVVGCGGTRIDTGDSSIGNETVWNTGSGGGTGGGVSALFPVPSYQANAKVPVSISTKKKGRGVPDVAADADPNSGYRIVVDGENQAIGGTSAAAPLWAGLFALINESRGRPVGQPHTNLYAHPTAFRDITQGDNRIGNLGYSAGPGWDACTGLGAPDGSALLRAFSGGPGGIA
jgi:kumamolisin